MRILVLGGNGFIGSHLVEALVANGARVRVMERSKNSQAPLIKGVDYRFSDFSDTIKLAEFLVDIDVVIHLISTTVPATANLDPIADINGNLLSTVRLLQLMRDLNVKRIIFLSSGGTVYGNVQSIPIPEEHDKNPISSYGIVKVAIENYISMFSLQHGIESLIIRPSNPYGPRQGHLGIQGVIPTFFQRIAAGEEIKIWGDGSTIRDYIYISDLIAFIMHGITKGALGVYNVGAGHGTSLLEILSLIEQITGISANVHFLPSRDFDVKEVVLDISKAQKRLSWAPLISLSEGCELYWKWMRKGMFNNIES